MEKLLNNRGKISLQFTYWLLELIDYFEEGMFKSLVSSAFFKNC